ncbi:glycosyltransferase [Butyrivibrio sp.]|uniref:CgeB family protein n=1 Tax=Butyrivibrio sp. TaxID=28121 RepID=UPI0025C6074F|nr:glycosyltransferase [Butyrivibrio sp.]MBQ9301592.1 glycosyltransferase [Butyrivibrio sp.]
MNILFLDWKSIGNEDLIQAAKKLGISVTSYGFDNHIDDDDKEFMEKFEGDIGKLTLDFVLSFNYFPVVSKVCNKLGIEYAAWVYDNPAVRLFSYTLINKCNYIFVFDSQMYELFATQGFKNVFYLPMASAVERYDSMAVTDDMARKYGGDISFVGQLYTEDHTYYDRLEGKISEYTKGYLEGLINTQMSIQGVNIIESSLTEQAIAEMEKVLEIKPGYDSVATYEYLYANYVINRKITALERSEIIREIGKKYPVKLYTKDKTFSAEGVDNRGEADYYLEMPVVFKTSAINLNISLRSIQRGIPLRAMDIMGCGGFLLSNYQEDYLRFFVPGEDFVYYESKRDLMEKIEYYLSHEEERQDIAKRGHAKILADHTYERRLQEIIDIVTAGGT